jgi:hypothetical protein
MFGETCARAIARPAALVNGSMMGRTFSFSTVEAYVRHAAPPGARRAFAMIPAPNSRRLA